MTVYVMRSDADPTTYKIGRAGIPEDRLAALRAANPTLKIYRLFDSFDPADDAALERYVHTRLANFRLHTDSTSRECFTFKSSEEADALFDEISDEFDSLLPCLHSAKGFEECVEEADLDDPIPSSNTLKSLCIDYSRAKEEKIAAENRLSYIEAQIKSMVGNARGVEGLIEWVPSKKMLFSQSKFKEAHPELHAQFKETSFSRKSFKLVW